MDNERLRQNAPDELERLNLATMVREPKALAFSLSKGCKKEHFQTEYAREVYGILTQLASSKPLGFDAIKFILLDRAKGGEVQSARLPEYLAYVDDLKRLEASDSFEFSYERWSEHIERQRFRGTMQEASRILATTGDLRKAQAHLASTMLVNSGSVTAVDLEEGAYERFLDRQKRKQRGDIMVIPTGFPTLDTGLEGGLMTGTVTLIAGYPMVGKSFLLTTMLINAFQAGVDVLHVATENTIDQAMTRAEAMHFDMTYRHLRDCSRNIDLEALRPEAKRPNRYMMIRLYNGRYSVEDLYREIKLLEIQHNFKPRLVGIDSPDYLKLEPNGDFQKHDLITQQIEYLKVYGEQECVAILGTSHVKLAEFRGRRAKKMDRLDMGDLSDSAGKARVADMVFTANSSVELERFKAIELFTAKLRDQEATRFSVLLKRDIKSPRFIEAPISSEYET